MTDCNANSVPPSTILKPNNNGPLLLIVKTEIYIGIVRLDVGYCCNCCGNKSKVFLNYFNSFLRRYVSNRTKRSIRYKRPNVHPWEYIQKRSVPSSKKQLTQLRNIRDDVRRIFRRNPFGIRADERKMMD